MFPRFDFAGCHHKQILNIINLALLALTVAETSISGLPVRN
jgi:hypothetical protein